MCFCQVRVQNPSETFDFQPRPFHIQFRSITITDIGTNCITSLNQDITVLSGAVPSVSSDPTICEGEIQLAIRQVARIPTAGPAAQLLIPFTSGSSAAGSPYTVTVTGAVEVVPPQIHNLSLWIQSRLLRRSVVLLPQFVENDSSLLYVVTPTGGNFMDGTITGGTIDSGQNSDSVMVSWDLQ